MDEIVIQTLNGFLTGQMAHKNFEDAINDFPINKINLKIDNIPYSFWHLLEHIRIAQKDIVEYVLDPNYKSPNWPDGYWPPRDKKATPDEWNVTVNEIRRLYKKSKSIVENKSLKELGKRMDHVANNHSILREIIMIIDHNAYHIGQFVTMRMIINYMAKNKDSSI